MTSWFSPKTEKRTSPIQGRGLFAREAIAASEIVAVKGGAIMDAAAFALVRDAVTPAEIQIEDGLYIAPSSAEDVEANILCLNHSCNPNVGVRGQVTFVAMRDIAAGAELTLDYAMIDGDPAERMECSCGAPECRTIITGDDWRRRELQRRYAGFFSRYLQQRIAAEYGARLANVTRQAGGARLGGLMPFDLQPILKGELLELRPLRPEDFAGLYAVASDPLIWEQHPARDRYQEEVFQRFFREALGSGGALIAIDSRDGKIIGSSRYHGYDPAQSEIEIGWTFLARSYWGGSFNREMKRLMLRHAFRFVDRVIFVVGPQNLRSRRALEKIGAVLVGSRTDQDGRENVVYRITGPAVD